MTIIENQSWRSTAIGAVAIRLVSIVAVMVVAVLASVAFEHYQPGVREHDPEGVLRLSVAGSIVAIGVGAVRPALRRTASVSIAWTFATVAWATALVMSTDGEYREDWIFSTLILGGAYIGVLHPMAQHQMRIESAA